MCYAGSSLLYSSCITQHNHNAFFFFNSKITWTPCMSQLFQNLIIIGVTYNQVRPTAFKYAVLKMTDKYSGRYLISGWSSNRKCYYTETNCSLRFSFKSPHQKTVTDMFHLRKRSGPQCAGNFCALRKHVFSKWFGKRLLKVAGSWVKMVAKWVPH